MISQALLKLIEKQASLVTGLSVQTLTMLNRLWTPYRNWYDYDVTLGQSARSSTIVEAAMKAARQRQRTYMRFVYRELGLTMPKDEAIDTDGGVQITIPGGVELYMREGVTPLDVYQRPAEEFRYFKSTGVSDQEALEKAIDRVTTMADTDLSLTRRDENRRIFRNTPKVTGYRRIIHPERSQDGTSCGLCVVASTRIYTTDQLMPIHDECIPEGTEVSAMNVSHITRRYYSGNLEIITTASGKQFSVTPNHPVLTDRGWVPAQFVTEGDNVLRHLDGHGVIGRAPNEDKTPALIENIWSSAIVGSDLGLRVMEVTPQQFHGDFSDGEVNVVTTDSLLPDMGDVTFGKPTLESELVDTGLGWIGFSGQGSPDQRLFFPDDTSGSHVSGSCDSLPVLDSGLVIPGQDGLLMASLLDVVQSQDAGNKSSGGIVLPAQGDDRLTTAVAVNDELLGQSVTRTVRFDPSFANFSGDGREAYAKFGTDLLERLTGDVELDPVVEKRTVDFAGHVYNLQTGEGWYSANNYIVSNCNCDVMPIVGDNDPGDELNRNDIDTINAIYEAAGGNDAGALLKTKVSFLEHGELGPIIAGGNRKGSKQRKAVKNTPHLTPVEKVEKELHSLRKSSLKLLERQRQGEDLSQYINWQRDRIAVLERRLVAIRRNNA